MLLPSYISRHNLLIINYLQTSSFTITHFQRTLPQLAYVNV